MTVDRQEEKFRQQVADTVHAIQNRDGRCELPLESMEEPGYEYVYVTEEAVADSYGGNIALYIEANHYQQWEFKWIESRALYRFRRKKGGRINSAGA